MSELLVNTIKKADGTGSLTVPAESGTVVIKDGSNDVTLNNITATGVYLGGTGAANYLDDYEEGTWTPAPSAGSWSGDNVSGHYVKVGRMVSIIVDVRNVTIDATASTSNVITNLPFTNGGKRSACSQITYYNTFDNVNVAGIIETNNTQIIFVQIQASGAWLTSTFRNANNSYIQLFATYYTDY